MGGWAIEDFYVLTKMTWDMKLTGHYNLIFFARDETSVSFPHDMEWKKWMKEIGRQACKQANKASEFRPIFMCLKCKQNAIANCETILERPVVLLPLYFLDFKISYCFWF